MIFYKNFVIIIIQNEREEKSMKLLTYLVIYLDDNRTKHITVVKGIDSLNFIRDRFTVLEYSVVEMVEYKEVELVW